MSNNYNKIINPQRPRNYKLLDLSHEEVGGDKLTHNLGEGATLNYPQLLYLYPRNVYNLNVYCEHCICSI